MSNPVVKDIQVAGLTLVDADGLPEETRRFVQAMAVDGLELIPTPMRCTEEECQGSFNSILFGAFDGPHDLVGIVSISTINLLEQVGNLLKVKAVVLPYFPGVDDELATVEALFARLFRQSVELVNGTQLALLDVTEFKRLKVLDDAIPKQARIKAIIQKIEDAGFPDVTPDPVDEAREIVTVRGEA